MKSVKSKKVSKKAPRTSASKPKVKESAAGPNKAFESTTQFNDGTLVTSVGFDDGQINIYRQSGSSGVGETLFLSSTIVAAFMRTMVKKMVTDGIRMEDFL